MTEDIDVKHARDVSSDFSGPGGDENTETDASSNADTTGSVDGFDPASDDANNVRERVIKYTYEDAVQQGFDKEASKIRREPARSTQEHYAEELHRADGFEATFTVREEVYGR